LGIPKEVSQTLIKAREEKRFENQNDLLQRVPELVPSIGEVSGLITYQSMMPYYTIESKGKSKDGTSSRGVKVIVKVDPLDKKGYRMIQWVDVLI